METTLTSMDRHEFFRLLGTGVGAMLLTRCSGESSGDPDPNAGQLVDLIINLDDKINANLKVKGGYVITSNNILVAQTNDGKFLAVSARCTHPEGKALLVYKAAENQFYCPQDLSRFDATGKVVSGPATQALKQYVVAMQANGTVRVQTMP